MVCYNLSVITYHFISYKLKMFLVIKDLERLMNMYFEENYDGFITGIACAIQRAYPCPENEGESGTCIGDSITYEGTLASRWRAAASYHQLPKILKNSVADDLDYIQAIEHSIRRTENPVHVGAYGIIGLFDNFSGDDILKKLIETGNRRLSLASVGSTLGEDILYFEKEPCELDISWLMSKGALRSRYIAFPWKEDIKVLIVGNHPRAESYFGKGWVFPYLPASFPKHFIKCYTLATTPWHSAYNKFSAFVVDKYENVKGVVELFNLMEQMVYMVNSMARICSISSNSDIPRVPGKYAEESARNSILATTGLSRKILSILMLEYVCLYRKVQAHEFYTNGMMTDFIDNVVDSSYFYGGIRLLRKTGIEEILGMPIDDLVEEEEEEEE